MTDFAVGDVVKLKSGGHDMTVQEIKKDDVTCIWSHGTQVKKLKFSPNLLAKKGSETPARIERLIVLGHGDIDEIVSEMRDAGTTAADGSFNITDELARQVLKRFLGPQEAN